MIVREGAYVRSETSTMTHVVQLVVNNRAYAWCALRAFYPYELVVTGEPVSCWFCATRVEALNKEPA